MHDRSGWWRFAAPQSSLYRAPLRSVDERDLGRDFASTLGVGGVLGTKFTWPDGGPKLRDVNLTPEKEGHWKKWLDLYNQKMLSRGVFRNLYVCGYDIPEGYAIEKDGRMYYAFFAPDPAKPTFKLLKREQRGIKAGAGR